MVPSQALDSQFEEKNSSIDDKNELISHIKNIKEKGTGGGNKKISQTLKRKANTEREHQEKVQNTLGPDQSITRGAADVVTEAG